MLKDVYTNIVQLVKNNKKQITDFYWYFGLVAMTSQIVMYILIHYSNMVLVGIGYVIIMIFPLMRWWK